MHLRQLAYTIPVHIIKDSFCQFDKESVVLPCFCKNLNKIGILGPVRKGFNPWQDIVLQKRRVDAQEVLIEASTIVSEIALLYHVVVNLDVLLRGDYEALLPTDI